MNYIEELFARQGALLRAVSRSGSRRRAEESREGEKSPSPAAEVWELAEEMARGSFAKRRVDWAGPSGRQLLRSRAEYARVLREMGCAAETGRVLSAGEAKEEEAAINGDVYSFVAEMVGPKRV